jgi:hypothetical protein
MAGLGPEILGLLIRHVCGRSRAGSDSDIGEVLRDVCSTPWGESWAALVRKFLKLFSGNDACRRILRVALKNHFIQSRHSAYKQVQ